MQKYSIPRLDGTAHIKHAKKIIIINIKMAGKIQPHKKYLKLNFRQETNYRAEIPIWALFYLLIDFVIHSASFVILAPPARQDHRPPSHCLSVFTDGICAMQL